MKKIYKLVSTFVVLLSAATNLQAQTYCIPSVSSPAADDEIRYVMFGTMSNTTGCSVVAPGPGSIGGAYSNFTGSAGIPNLAGSIPAPVCIMGNSYPLSAGLTMCATGIYSGIFGAFIDFNQNGSFSDPGENVWNSTYPSTGALSPAFNIFSAPGLGIAIPFTATPGLTRLRIWQSETSIMGGPCGSITWGEVEDYVINIVPPTPCSTTPGANTILTTTSTICPNTTVPLGLTTSYTVGNIGYEWSYSNQSALGPFTVIPTSTTTAALTSPQLSVTSWIQLNTWCANGGSTLTLPAVQVSVSPVTTTNVPYYEGFEGITTAGQLPNCSWVVNNPNASTYISSQTNNRIPRTGSKFASVYGYNLTGTNYYYTNGVYLFPGVTYSAGLFYTTEYYGYTNFSELSIQLGTSQSTTGLVTIVTQSVAISPIYKALGSTFTVPTAGLYYAAIKVRSTAGSFAYYLSWDDFSITIPCNLNTPVIAVSANASTICAGQSVNLTATGANTYTWNTGANTSTVTDTPTSNYTYIAYGTNTLTNCMASITKNIVVRPTPVVSIVPSATAVCEGSAVNLIALGASSYTWNNGNTSSFLSANPTANTTYTVIGSYGSGNNCTSASMQMITVNPLPTIGALNSPATTCPGQNVNLSGSGATTYEWISNSGYFQGSPVIASPMVSTTYSLTGTDENGCSKTISVSQVVVSCVGINEQYNSISGLSVYPNPTGGIFTVELVNGLNKNVEITDVTGRIILATNTADDKIDMNISNLSNGIYYLKIKSNNTVEVLKVVKQ